MDVWNDQAATFAEHWGSLADPARHAIADALELRPGMRLLDIGCGSGDFCALALARGAQVSGIDVAPAMVEIARERAAGADLRVGAMEHLPWEDGAFDAVTGFNSLQFAADPVDALREWVRVVRPGGKLAICAWGPRENNDLEAVEAALRGVADSPAPGRSFGREGNLEAVARGAGLELLAGATVAVPFEVPDQERLELALLFDARAYGVEETAARATIVAAATPFRRRDGSYRFENAFRYVISSPSANRTPAGS